jgi:4-oxalocrotonate tautomerase
MPHVIIKMYAGRSRAAKQRLADSVARVVTEVLRLGEEAVSVAVEDIAPADWMRKVYRPDIAETSAELIKPPGYGPLAKGTQP